MTPVVGKAVRIVPDVVKRSFSNIALDEHRRQGEAPLDISIAFDAHREDPGITAQPETRAFLPQLVNIADQALMLRIVPDIITSEHPRVRPTCLFLDNEIVEIPRVLAPDLHVAAGSPPGMSNLNLPRTDPQRREHRMNSLELAQIVLATLSDNHGGQLFVEGGLDALHDSPIRAGSSPQKIMSSFVAVDTE